MTLCTPSSSSSSPPPHSYQEPARLSTACAVARGRPRGTPCTRHASGTVTRHQGTSLVRMYKSTSGWRGTLLSTHSASLVAFSAACLHKKRHAARACVSVGAGTVARHVAGGAWRLAGDAPFACAQETHSHTVWSRRSTRSVQHARRTTRTAHTFWSWSRTSISWSEA